MDEKIKELHERIKDLENVMGSITKSYEDITNSLMYFDRISSNYFKLLRFYFKHGRISPDLIVPEVEDDAIARGIILVLFEEGESNISQIAEGIRLRRGKASRTTVRERLEMLGKKGVVEVTGSGKNKKYKISDELVKTVTILPAVSI